MWCPQMSDTSQSLSNRRRGEWVLSTGIGSKNMFLCGLNQMFAYITEWCKSGFVREVAAVYSDNKEKSLGNSYANKGKKCSF